MLVTLKVQDMHLELDPAAGGSVRSLRHRDLDILRPGPVRTGPAFTALNSAAFPMIPFVGRIHNGVITTSEKDIVLPPNFPPEPHAIHGHGWQDAWTVESASETSATLFYKYPGNAWPWAYEARQTFEVTPNALALTLSAKNVSERSMPVGLGWHPYFIRKDAQLRVPTSEIWNPDQKTGENTPSAITTATDLSLMQPVDHLHLDTTFSLREPTIEMSWPTHSVTLSADPIFHHATIYVPPGEDFFCAEPISHAPNSMNSALDPAATGQKWIEPGATFSGRMMLIVARR